VSGLRKVSDGFKKRCCAWKAEGVRRFWRDFFSDWDEFHAEPRDVVDAGSQVAVVMRMKGRMRELEIDELWSQLWTLRSGRFIHIQSFSNPDGALEAAGLSD
jgi:ketosteroid isomerase-like protein